MKINAIIIGLLVIAGLTNCQTSVPVTGPSGTVCESPGGSCVGLPTGTHIGYKNNCSKYIVCQGGCGCDMECPENLHFNSELQVCDWPDNAGCDPSYSPNPVPGGNGTVPSTPGCESPGGSCKGVDTGKLINYANNCSRYIACQGGCGIAMDCPANLHFNYELQLCDWPDQAGCDPSYAPNPGPGESPTPNPGPGGSPTPNPGPGGSPAPNPGPGVTPTPDPGPGVTPTPTPGSGGNGTVPSTPGCESPGGSCKGVDTGKLINYANNCSRYIACQGGCGIAMDCPANLHFNYELQLCDWPDQAGCDPSYAPNPGPGGSPTPNPGPGGSPAPNPGPGVTPTPNPGPGVTPTPTPGSGGNGTVPSTPGCESPGGSCKGVDTGKLINYANNCSRYIACQGGCGIAMDCPANLHFNYELQLCDWPDQAGCDPSYAPNPGPGESPTPNPGPGGSPTPNPGPGGSPAPNPGPGVTPTPNPGPGVTPTPNPGPGGSPTPNPGPGESPAPNPGPGESPTPNPAPGGPATGPSGTVCESQGGSCVGLPTGTHIGYANNCSKYIVCQGGCGCDMNCPDNLHFNSELQVCDWPDQAGCDPSYAASTE